MSIKPYEYYVNGVKKHLLISCGATSVSVVRCPVNKGSVDINLFQGEINLITSAVNEHRAFWKEKGYNDKYLDEFYKYLEVTPHDVVPNFHLNKEGMGTYNMLAVQHISLSAFGSELVTQGAVVLADGGSTGEAGAVLAASRAIERFGYKVRSIVGVTDGLVPPEGIRSSDYMGSRMTNGSSPVRGMVLPIRFYQRGWFGGFGSVYGWELVNPDGSHPCPGLWIDMVGDTTPLGNSFAIYRDPDIKAPLECYTAEIMSLPEKVVRDSYPDRNIGGSVSACPRVYGTLPTSLTGYKMLPSPLIDGFMITSVPRQESVEQIDGVDIRVYGIGELDFTFVSSTSKIANAYKAEFLTSNLELQAKVNQILKEPEMKLVIRVNDGWKSRALDSFDIHDTILNSKLSKARKSVDSENIKPGLSIAQAYAKGKANLHPHIWMLGAGELNDITELREDSLISSYTPQGLLYWAPDLDRPTIFDKKAGDNEFYYHNLTDAEAFFVLKQTGASAMFKKSADFTNAFEYYYGEGTTVPTGVRGTEFISLDPRCFLSFGAPSPLDMGADALPRAVASIKGMDKNLSAMEAILGTLPALSS